MKNIRHSSGSPIGSSRYAESGTPKGYVLDANGGEELVHFRDGGVISIKIRPGIGSERLTLATQQVMIGSGIPIHRHLHMDEAFYVLKGSGTFLMNDEHYVFEMGGTIFIPQGTWHGFENPDHELLLLWVVVPAGLDSFFLETCSPPGAPPRQLTQNQISEIALKYSTEFR